MNRALTIGLLMFLEVAGDTILPQFAALANVNDDAVVLFGTKEIQFFGAFATQVYINWDSNKILSNRIESSWVDKNIQDLILKAAFSASPLPHSLQ